MRVELAAELGRPVRETVFVDVRSRCHRHREPMLRRERARVQLPISAQSVRQRLSLERAVNLRQLEYLVAIAEGGSFRAAAHHLHVAAPSISQQIRLLELEVGGPLLERLPRGARLTPAGRAFLPEARSALLAAQRAPRAGARRSRSSSPRSRSRRCSRSRSACCRRRSSACARPIRACRCGSTSSTTARSSRTRSMRASPTSRSGPSPARPARPVGLPRLRVVRRHHRPAAPRVRLARPHPPRFARRRRLDPVPGHARPARHRRRRSAQPPDSRRATPSGRRRSRRPRGSRRPGVGVAIVPANIVPSDIREHVRETDPPIFRKLAAYTRAEFSPQADALIAALRARPGSIRRRRLHPRLKTPHWAALCAARFGSRHVRRQRAAAATASRRRRPRPAAA